MRIRLGALVHEMHACVGFLCDADIGALRSATAAHGRFWPFSRHHQTMSSFPVLKAKLLCHAQFIERATKLEALLRC